MLELFLTDTTTGETRCVQKSDESWTDYDDGLEYLWTDGNYGCDHNRVEFFRWAHDETEQPGDEDCGCYTHTDRFHLRAVQDGVVVYDEDAE